MRFFEKCVNIPKAYSKVTYGRMKENTMEGLQTIKWRDDRQCKGRMTNNTMAESHCTGNHFNQYVNFDKSLKIQKGNQNLYIEEEQTTKWPTTSTKGQTTIYKT